MSPIAGPGVMSLIPARPHTFVKIDHEIFSIVILLFPLIQESLLLLHAKHVCEGSTETPKTGPRSCSTQLRMKFIMLINVQIPIIVGILINLSVINTASEHLKARKVFIFKHLRFYEHLKFHTQLH